jgi:hypothetical protein
MSLYKYFQLVKGLPNPNGSLSESLSAHQPYMMPSCVKSKARGSYTLQNSKLIFQSMLCYMATRLLFVTTRKKLGSRLKRVHSALGRQSTGIS